MSDITLTFSQKEILILLNILSVYESETDHKFIDRIDAEVLKNKIKEEVSELPRT